MKNNPFLNRNFVSAIMNLDGGNEPSSDELWKKAHFITTTVAQYCSEKQIHPAYVCAWFGTTEPSECYSEAAMLASMSLLETLKGEEEGSW